MDDVPSHALVRAAIRSLCRLTHRGAVAADGKTGDGCGLLLKRPEKFLRAVAKTAGIELNARFAAGLVFLDPDPELAQKARTLFEAEISEAGLATAGWREVPLNSEACGETALRTLPKIEHLFVNAGDELDEADFERKLFVARRRVEMQLKDSDPVFYVASLSAHTLSYKAMVMPANLDTFYPDLLNPKLQSSVCLFHQRFSTNTLPQWRLAQPFRMLAHNGEINTIQGNRNWASSRTTVWQSPLLPDLTELQPLVSMSGSDSASLDNMLEVLLAGQMDMLQALRLL
ncbi:MAG: glutamate synthase large subunit, partial [Gammaproteobacteria bacterium]|nr:glutamate synthase large subunit [Gammaproteobacteria bacterium]